MSNDLCLDTVLTELDTKDRQAGQDPPEQIKTASAVALPKPTNRSGKTKEAAITAAIQRARLAAGDLSV